METFWTISADSSRTSTKWGHKHRVTFDPAKEYFCILHRTHCDGEAFRLLGTMIDPKLIMEDEIRRIHRKCRPKIKAILATRGVYSTSDLVVQFKTNILCLLEYSNAAIYSRHAFCGILACQ